MIEKLENTEEKMILDFEIKLKEILKNLRKDHILIDITAYNELTFEGKELIIKIGAKRK